MRSSGILMHISSLPSPYGIGALGKSAYDFVDFAAAAKQSYWQILPLGPTGLGDSPYQSFSTFAGNPYFIDLDLLCDDGLLERDDIKKIRWRRRKTKVHYPALYRRRFDVLLSAYARFSETANPGFGEFCESEKIWLDEYALFMAIKNAHGDVSWHEWDEPYKKRDKKTLGEFRKDHGGEIDFWKFTQFIFDRQWRALKDYANQKGIKIIGDMPIYVADDSADVWANPELFMLGKDLVPTVVSGCPPDYFSDDGQLWGNPIYNWAVMKRQKYRWWTERLKKEFERCDAVRLDHFRGFESYYVLDYGAKTARDGRWVKGPGQGLFDTIKKELGDVEIIAENLGLLTCEVRDFHNSVGYPGMRVLQFGFESDDRNNENMPHNIDSNNVVYAGTHDNPTVREWYRRLSRWDRKFCKNYIGETGSTRDFVWAFIEQVHSTAADISIISMQDYLGLGARARMNRPSTTGRNWQWRAKPGDFDPKLSSKIATVTELYLR